MLNQTMHCDPRGWHDDTLSPLTVLSLFDIYYVMPAALELHNAMDDLGLSPLILMMLGQNVRQQRVLLDRQRARLEKETRLDSFLKGRAQFLISHLCQDLIPRFQ